VIRHPRYERGKGIRGLLSRIALTLLASSMFLGAFSAFAQNIRWLEYSPVRYFDDQDWDMARAAVRKALEDGGQEAPVRWTNAESGHSGSAAVVETMQRADQECRRVRIENAARGLTGQSVFVFCRQPDGEWKVGNPAQ